MKQHLLRRMSGYLTDSDFERASIQAAALMRHFKLSKRELALVQYVLSKVS